VVHALWDLLIDPLVRAHLIEVFDIRLQHTAKMGLAE
jgi:hypothetical protein